LIPCEISIECSASEFGPDRFIRLDEEVGSIDKQGLIEIGLHEIGTELEIEILGDLFKATVIEDSSCDPHNEKLRA
jgi:hypothetical protein